MRICPRCKKSERELQTVVKDAKTKKHWLITYCGKCHFNYELEESKGGTTAQQEIDKPSEMPWTKPNQDPWTKGWIV
jgi:transcription elongation factor Elf1